MGILITIGLVIAAYVLGKRTGRTCTLDQVDYEVDHSIERSHLVRDLTGAFMDVYATGSKLSEALARTSDEEIDTLADTVRERLNKVLDQYGL